MNNFYYESEFESLLFDFFEKKYNLKDEKLQFYLICKYMILNKITSFNKIKNNSFYRFIIEEFYIDSSNISDCFLYKNSKFYINSATNQSISNIIESKGPYFQQLFNPIIFKPNNWIDVNTISSSIINEGKNKSKNKKGFYKKYYYEYIVLNKLNQLFNVSPIYCTIENTYPLNKTIRTQEEIIEGYVKEMYLDSDNSKLIKEKDIENFIYYNLKDLLDITPIQRQYALDDDCICDIYAKNDKENIIIEIKNCNDDRLLWQVLKYRKKAPDSEIIIITTDIKNNVLTELKKHYKIKVYKCVVHIDMGKIDKIDLSLL